MSLKVLFVCTGNSCRSPMAEALTKKIFPFIECYSAGIIPEKSISQHTLAVLNENGIDFSNHLPKSIEKFLPNSTFDYIICLGETAYSYCLKVITDKIKVVFWEIEDPMETHGENEVVLNKYRQVLLLLKKLIIQFFFQKLK